MSKIIAVTGKGGTGKSMLSTSMVRILAKEQGARVLAIDADSAISLSYALGMEVKKTLSEMRTEIIEDPRLRKSVMDRHVQEVIEQIVQHGDGFDLVVMGRSEGPGCYCGINDLLRYGIESLSKRYDYTIVDGEAGPEQINRRALRSLDILVILTDTSRRAFQTAEVIQRIAGGGGAANLGQKGLVVNRLKADVASVKQFAEKLGLKVYGYIPEDDNITQQDLAGLPIFAIPADSPSLQAVRSIMKEMGIDGRPSQAAS